ncbi:glycyl-radical enzyme activating protein [bacterium]|nr:glycyl-radical enzyme activating protein [bacterium]
MTKNQVRGQVFDIKKFAIHDGPGIRTTVFLKGCPLSCLWCHNPESQSFEPELFFLPELCTNCGHCVSVCPNSCHQLINGVHVMDREKCTACGLCASECYAGALELVGRTWTVDEVLTEVLKDKAFYENSGGGMTISGGEPMSQFKFTKALLTAAKKKGLHNCLDSCGWAPFEKYAELFDVVDLFLWDYKATDSELHRELTGVPNERILENLARIDAAGKPTILRCPLVPGVNADETHLQGLIRTARTLKHLQQIDLLPYHPLGKSKLERLGRENNQGAMSFVPPEQVEQWTAMVSAAVDVPVKHS